MRAASRLLQLLVLQYMPPHNTSDAPPLELPEWDILAFTPEIQSAHKDVLDALADVVDGVKCISHPGAYSPSSSAFLVYLHQLTAPL